MIIQNESTEITLSFKEKHSSSDAVKDLEILSKWANGQTINLSKTHNNALKPIFQFPCIPKGRKEKQINDFISNGIALYKNICKLEQFLDVTFTIPSIINTTEHKAIIHLLAKYEPLNVTDYEELNLELKYSEEIVDLMSEPHQGFIEMSEDDDVSVTLFGETYHLGKRKTLIKSPVIMNIDKARKQILMGKKPKLKIGSSTGEIFISYVEINN